MNKVSDWHNSSTYICHIQYIKCYMDIGPIEKLYYFFLAIGEGFEQKMAEKKKNL